MPASLAGLNLLVTRPAHQAQSLSRLLESQGARVIRLPLINIKPLSNPQLPTRSHYDVIIFVSNNAVHLGAPLISSLMKRASIATVGKGTATCLQELGYPVDILPEQHFDSEGLLNHPDLQQVNGQSILIVRGEGGRPLLGDTLQQRGAQVDYLAAYQRGQPDSNLANVLHGALQEPGLDIILISSGEALQNLLSLCSKQDLAQLLETQLAVTHPRQADKAKQLGFTRAPIISSQPGDESLLEALLQWQQP